MRPCSKYLIFPGAEGRWCTDDWPVLDDQAMGDGGVRDATGDDVRAMMIVRDAMRDCDARVRDRRSSDNDSARWCV